jgi:hypothetical protein
MRLKHNKKRNTAFVYEALVRELTKSIVKNNKNKQTKIVSIIKEHFDGQSILQEELQLYKSLYETEKINKDIAEKIMLEAKQNYSSLDKKRIFKEQSALINKINKTLSSKIFTNFVPNYKSLATVYSIFNDKLPPKDRVLLEEKVLHNMSREESEQKKEAIQPIDNIVYNTFVEKFNNKYTGKLLDNQKKVLTKYISSFSDNGVELKSFLNEEIYSLKERLNNSKLSDTIIKDDNVVGKIDKVLNIFESYKQKELDEEFLELVLKTQSLAEELES